ncbi:MAG: DUF2520 domain-containing protein [Pseudomonadota bacterium]
MKYTIAIVGSGKVGTTLGYLLSRSGYSIAGFASRTIESAERAAKLIGSGSYSNHPAEITCLADAVFITTPDRVIEQVCAEIVLEKGFKSNSVVFHCSGAFPSEALASARKCGAHVGSLHPLQSFASADKAVKMLAGGICVFEGDTVARHCAEMIAKDIGVRLVYIRPDEKPLYHAAAVVASNYLVTLIGLAVDLAASAGFSKEESLRGIMSLAQGVLDNVSDLGVSDALTGPITRGDIDTISSHIRAIKLRVPHLLSLYSTLGQGTIQIAKAQGSLSRELIEQMEALFQI